ncbi:glycosyltransferase family 2 protein [Nocardioides carbamazepini]|uniref:glycosyltransferase family 2 protein n=1 Tax=Nocardioides carbamazepini TaxID=2854259 RepID=UPI00214A1BBA|nr:glycosyltransferase family 2 protein [Nocardioides carbamazepini]MCR1783549.1 glycosyltransferase family 2 protein [Nocardioides carbamazepini]
MAEAPAVSVVIPTYRSGPGLDRAIASLDAQTMPQDGIEVLLLDDGSPDDTADRIERIASGRANYRAFALEASGWPSRPRNIGVREARGRYVLFMDHDDELYPDALRAAVTLGDRSGDGSGDGSGADVVNGKEVRTQVARWGLTHYTHDTGDARDEPLRGLLPMTPHKLYRREFLLANDIRFPEAPRHLWEDIFFQVELIEHEPVVALLSSTPFYHWRHTGENSSTTAEGERDYRGTPDYWPYLEKLLGRITEVRDPGLRVPLLAHTAHVRLVPEIGHRPTGRAASEIARDRAEIERLVAAYVPPDVDELLPARSRVALTLFRAGEAEAAADFLRDGIGRRPEYTVTAVEDTGDGAVRVTGTVAWTRVLGQPFARRTADGRVVRDLPEPLAGLLAERGLTPSADVGDAFVDVAIRHAPTRVNWLLPSTSRVELVEQEDGTLEPAGRFTATFDPRTAAMGNPLPPGAHLVLGMCELDGRTGIKRAFSDLPAGTQVGPVGLDYSAHDGLLLRVPAAEPPARKGLLKRLRRN